ncbi:hypothetical protein EWM64_g4098, partial [Hericium alpestre]
EFCSSFEILEAVVGVSKAISLRSLTLVNIAVADESVYERPEFMALLRGLSQLQITVVSNEKLDPKINRDYPDDPWSIFWEDIMFQRILPSLNGSSALTHLVLHSGEHIGIKPTFSFKALRFPCLSSLSLMRITFDEKIGTEDFIIRHKATLSRLELCRCLLLVHFDEDKPARLWSQIWDRFAKELTGLKEFMLSTEWDQNARRDKYGDYPAFTYAGLLKGWKITPYAGPSDAEEQDTSAFTGFEGAIDKRFPVDDFEYFERMEHGFLEI